MKKFNVRILALAVMVTALLGFSGVANAAWGDGPNDGAYQTLSKEQQTKMQNLHSEFFTATEDIRQQMIIKRAELQAEMISSKPNTAKIEALSTELGALDGKMLVERSKLNNRISAEGLPDFCRGPGFMGHNGGAGGNWGGKHGGGHGGGWGGGGHGGNGSPCGNRN